MRKKIAVIILIVLIMNLSVGLAARKHTHWSRGPYYYLEENQYIYEKYRGCSHRKGYDYTGFSFETVDFDLELNQPSGVTSVGGIGFEKGTTLLKDIQFDITNISNAQTSRYGYSDRIISQGTALNSSLYSNNTKYELNMEEGIYTLSGQVRDRYPGDTVTRDEDFYIGPYPIVSCEIDLIDDNVKNSHIDSIKISNIKLKSTYRPQKLIFELYKGDTYTGKSFTAILSNATTYSTGYNSTFNNIGATNVGVNLKPGEAINISVRVVDGRGTGTANITDPNAPKYAKYSNTDVF